MDVYKIKDAGKPERTISKNEFIMRYGFRLSSVLMQQSFIVSAALLDEKGNIKTEITKGQ